MADPELLFAANRQSLFRYFCKAAGCADAARDLTQEVFVRVSRARVLSMPEHELKPWLFRIARNLVLDHHRRNRRHPAPATLTVEPSRAASQDIDAAVNEPLAARWFRSALHMKPNEIVEVALPQQEDPKGTFSDRAFSIRIRPKQIR